MPLGIILSGRSTPKLAVVIAALIAAGLWAQSSMRSDEPARVMGVTIWTGTQSLPAGYTVAAGQTVELNPNANTTVDLGGNFIVKGTLRSWPAAGVTHLFRFTGITEASFVGGGDVPLVPDKGLWVTGAGNLDLVGSPKLAWTRATASLAAGATSVTLETAPTGWQVGDEVVIAPTENPNVMNFSTRHELRTLTSVNGSTVGFGALSYPHPRVTVKPGVSYGAEVANLTRNVRIEGTTSGRSHVWIKSTTKQTIRHAALRYLGPRKGAAKVAGRYGLHFHRNDDASRGTIVEGVVARQVGAHAFVAHRSHGITFRDTVSIQTMEDAYWYDPGKLEAPDDTIYERALALGVSAQPGSSYHRLTGFHLGLGHGNTIRDSAAVGVQGGVSASGYIWPEIHDDIRGDPTNGVWTFNANVAHNNLQDGIFTWQNVSEGHIVARFVGYHNGRSGIEHGAYSNQYHYVDAILYGNQLAAVQLHAESEILPPFTSFERFYVDGAGITNHAVLLEEPTFINRPPSLWCGNAIQGLTGPAYLVSYTGEDSTVAERLNIKLLC